MIAVITPTRLTAKRKTALAQPANSLATMDNASTIPSFATKLPIALTNLMNHFTVMSTNARRWKFINADINALIL